MNTKQLSIEIAGRLAYMALGAVICLGLVAYGVI